MFHELCRLVLFLCFVHRFRCLFAFWLFTWSMFRKVSIVFFTHNCLAILEVLSMVFIHLFIASGEYSQKVYCFLLCVCSYHTCPQGYLYQIIIIYKFVQLLRGWSSNNDDIKGEMLWWPAVLCRAIMVFILPYRVFTGK